MKIIKHLNIIQVMKLVMASNYDLERTLKLYMIYNIQKQIKEFKVESFEIDYENETIILTMNIKIKN